MISPLQMDLVAEELYTLGDGTEQFISLEDLRKKCPARGVRKTRLRHLKVQKDSHSPLYSKSLANSFYSSCGRVCSPTYLGRRACIRHLQL